MPRPHQKATQVVKDGYQQNFPTNMEWCAFKNLFEQLGIKK